MKTYGAVIYKIQYGRLYFLVERVNIGYKSIPAIQAEDDEELVCGIRKKTNLGVKLDTVFRHDTVYSFQKAAKKPVVFYAAEVNEDDMIRVEYEEGDPLEWRHYDEAITDVTDDQDKEVLSHAAVYLNTKYSLCLDMDLPELSAFGNVWYRENAVDIHSHIVPQVDDGSQSVNETMELLGLDWNEGIRWVFATPHYGIENGYAPDRNYILGGMRQLYEFVHLSSNPMKISLGTEWYCSEHIVERIRNQEAFPMGRSDWYMVEFLEWGALTESADDILRRLKMMKDNHIKTILAHPERYKAIQQDWDLAKRICDLGVLLQVNAYDLYLNPKDATRDLAQWMAREELISFIGSDMHGTRIKEDGKPARRPQMKEGIRWLYENVDDEYANEIVRVNAEKYLGVDKLL